MGVTNFQKTVRFFWPTLYTAHTAHEFNDGKAFCDWQGQNGGSSV